MSIGNYTHRVTCGWHSWLCFVDADGYLSVRHPELGDFVFRAVGGSVENHFSGRHFIVEKLNKFKGNK